MSILRSIVTWESNSVNISLKTLSDKFLHFHFVLGQKLCFNRGWTKVKGILWLCGIGKTRWLAAWQIDWLTDSVRNWPSYVTCSVNSLCVFWLLTFRNSSRHAILKTRPKINRCALSCHLLIGNWSQHLKICNFAIFSLPWTAPFILWLQLCWFQSWFGSWIPWASSTTY